MQARDVAGFWHELIPGRGGVKDAARAADDVREPADGRGRAAGEDAEAGVASFVPADGWAEHLKVVHVRREVEQDRVQERSREVVPELGRGEDQHWRAHEPLRCRGRVLGGQDREEDIRRERDRG
jgi:hypothetical protein